jgi:hypothetical protein
MDKVQLGKISALNVKVEHNGVVFEVENFLDFSKQIFLTNIYLEEYFKNPEESLVALSDYNFIDAECKLLYNLLKLNTNIDVDSMENDAYVDSPLMAKVAGAIYNFKSFRTNLSFMISEIKEQRALKASLGETVSALVSKGYELLDKVTDISPEQIEKVRTTGLELVEKLKENNPFGEFPGAVPAVINQTPQKKVRKVKK